MPEDIKESAILTVLQSPKERQSTLMQTKINQNAVSLRKSVVRKS
jgi:hypothetical protein